MTLIEKELLNLKFENDSYEEELYEILSELLDKSCQCFEIYDDHEVCGFC